MKTDPDDARDTEIADSLNLAAEEAAEQKAKHVFNNCNVCGRELMREDEFEIGMCAICANEEI